MRIKIEFDTLISADLKNDLSLMLDAIISALQNHKSSLIDPIFITDTASVANVAKLGNPNTTVIFIPLRGQDEYLREGIITLHNFSKTALH